MFKRTHRILVMAALALIGATTAMAQRGERLAPVGRKVAAASEGRIAPMTLGDRKADLLYTMFDQPCRIIDTRLAGGPITSASIRDFYAVDTGLDEIGGQGGTAGGCNIPLGAVAVMMNFVAVAPSGAGNLRGAASGQPIPATGSIINYAPVPGLSIANGLIFPICDSTDTLCGNDFRIQANGASTQLVVDVLGYFREMRSAFVHTTTVGNVFANATTINHPLTNGHPEALLFVTQNNVTGTADVHPYALQYGVAAADRWSIYNTSPNAMPVGANFNILVITP